ncbi:flavodoxin family protein [Microbacterium sp. A93]|uniref:flavodoxin family protein n=1 Tax=Microbacterium sp. A93 TaxID=3450716 RepID=UPI003F43D222
MKRLLVIHHAPTDGVRQLLDAVLEGAGDPEIVGVEIQPVPALAWAQGTQDETAILQADGYLFLTPANFGYMSGALKHVFDSTFLKIGGSLSADGSADGTDDAGRSRPRRPYGLIVHGRYDTTGAVRSVEGIVRALGWQSGGEPLEALGDVTAHHLASARELGATLAALLMT